MEPVTSGTSEPPPMEPATSGTSEPIKDPAINPPREPQEFDLSDPEQRKGLVDLLVQNHNSRCIEKIEVNLSE